MGTGDNSYSKDTLEWNLYHIDLPKSETVTTACNPWHLFTQYAPAPVVKLDDYLPRVKDVSFMVKSDFNGASFNIVAVGSYKAGKTAYDEFMQDKGNRTSAWLYMNPDVTYGTYKDSRDGQLYKTVTIKEQVWIAENMNYRTPNGSWCYNDDSTNCNIYGRLYHWGAAQTACPAGWRLPEYDDFSFLSALANVAAGNNHGSVADAIVLLKSQNLWDGDNGDNVSGFTALPGGIRKDGTFSEMYETSYFWTSEKLTDDWLLCAVQKR